MRPIVAAVFFTLLLSSPLLCVGYVLGQRDCQRTEPQQVVGPRGERGLPGVNGTDGKPGQDCDCAALKAEAMRFVGEVNERLGRLEQQQHETTVKDVRRDEAIKKLEASQCKCKCR